MIKDNQKSLNNIQIFLDALAVILSYSLTYLIMFFGNKPAGLSATIYFFVLIPLVPVYLVNMAIFTLYSPKRVSGIVKEISDIIKVNTIVVLLFALILFMGSKNYYIYNFSRKFLFLFYILNMIFIILERNIIRFSLRFIRAKGYNQKHILLIGYSRAARAYIDRVLDNRSWGYKVRGILDDKVERGFEYRGIKVIGSIDNLEMILELNVLDEIAITLSIDEYERLESIVNDCERSGVHTKFIPDYNHVIPTIPYIEDLSGLAVINIRHVPLSVLHRAIFKRIVDIVGSLVGIILFSPIMLIIAVLIKLTDNGPIIFSQERVGLHNKTFKMYKFRSMAVQNKLKEIKAWTVKDDPRITRIGRFIRKTSLDEIPQFFNILFGDMSLVGPRPERPFYVEKFKDEIPHYMIKHQVRPGLTGLAQIKGYRGDTSISKRIEYDLYYIENWTLGFDFKIMFLTIFKGFINKNAY